MITQKTESDERLYLPEETSKPKFSKDEKHLAYLKKLDQEVVLCVTELDDFSTREVFRCDSIVDFEWFDDSKHLDVCKTKKRGDEDLYFEEHLPVWFDNKGFWTIKEISFYF